MNTTEIHTAEDYKYYCEHGVFPEKEKKTEIQQLKEYDIDEDYWELLEMVRDKKAIFLKGNIPSSKNSKEIRQVYTGRSSCCKAPYIKRGKGEYYCTKCGNRTSLGTRPIIAYSKTVERYLEENEDSYPENRDTFLSWELSFPIVLGIYHIRDSKRAFDGINAAQIIFDMMVKNKYVEDDNMDYLRHVDLGYHKDPKNAGAIIVPLIPFNMIKRSLWRT